MKFSAKQYAKALMDSLSDTDPKDHDKVLDNFAKLLAENNDLRLFENIAEEFHTLELARDGIKQVEITSAHSLSPDREKEIIKTLNHLVGSKVEIKKKIDEGVIGGVMIQVDDKILDTTVKGQLEQLKDNLAN
ncbi:MAG TPA: ATP synthase F1 subunit delta [Methylomirabilota bacterium]|jgi:ATP synthase F1 delta subunit|nr:ATP synthase F1 subunit delta [Methylomirabilota bacterium]